MASIPGYLAAASQTTAVANEMRQFADVHPKGTLNLNCVLESSAYGKLTCSPYSGNKPPAEPVGGREQLAGVSRCDGIAAGSDYAVSVTYARWQAVERGCERREALRTVATRVILRRDRVVWAGRPSDKQLKLDYFCLATSDFMNLCDDLQQLANW